MLKNSIIAFLLLVVAVGGYKAVSNPQIKAALMGENNGSEIYDAPKKKEAISLAQRSMENFALSLKQGSMECFYNNLSNFWKQRTTVDKLNEVFAPFIKGRVDLTGLAKLQPLIEKGSGLLDNGDLRLIGHYNASNAVLKFTETYRYEKLNGWRLVEFFVQIVPKKQQTLQPTPHKK